MRTTPARGAVKIMVDIDPQNPQDENPIHLPIVADAKNFLEALKASPARFVPWLATLDIEVPRMEGKVSLVLRASRHAESIKHVPLL